LNAEAMSARYPSLEIETLLANPLAHQTNRRFVDDDMNRMFTAERLARESPRGYEPRRAKEISDALGPKGEWRGAAGDGQAADLVVDLHTTTANMGCTIIVDSWCSFGMRAAAYASGQWDSACRRAGVSSAQYPLRVLTEDFTQAESPYLCSVGRHGLMIEVGPSAQGLLRASCIAATELALSLVFEFVDRCNRGDPPPLPPTLGVYVDVGSIPWPQQDDTLPEGVVHPSLQDADFVSLSKGGALFLMLDGTVVTYDGSFGDEVVPIFVNEAAYYYSQSGAGIGIATMREVSLQAE